MKKFFEEPSIECLVLCTESIADVIEGDPSIVDPDAGWGV